MTLPWAPLGTGGRRAATSREQVQMKQCTLFCRRDEPSAVATILGQELEAITTFEGVPENWAAANFAYGKSSIRAVRTVRLHPGDKVSKTLLGLTNWLERVAVRHPYATPLAVKRVLQTSCMVGLTGTPEFSEEAGHFDVIFRLADALDAIIWNGSALLLPNGDVLIDVDGESELEGLRDAPSH